MIVVYCASHHDNRESLSTGELLNVMSVFLLVCIGMEQYGVYMSSNFMLSGLHPLAKDVLHSPSQIWQNKMRMVFSECTIACIQLRQPVDILNLTCINIIYITSHVDVCTAPTAVCSSSPHSRPRWLQLRLIYTLVYTSVTELLLNLNSLRHLHQICMHKTWLGHVYTVYIVAYVSLPYGIP